ncbi:MAG: HEAT repeat domain-containing protein [Rickettsiaceae bacterium]|nr:HEAT repeat domain-containing protein [Rickettsiaceae bacterium]
MEDNEMKVNLYKYFCSKKHLLQSSFILIVLFLVNHNEAWADFSEKEYSFSSLITNADLIVTGEIDSVQLTVENYEMIFHAEDILYNSESRKQFKILSKTKNGFRLPEEPYLERGGKYLLILKKESDYYSIVNGLAGIFNVSVKDDILKILTTYKQNKQLFTEKNTNEKIDLFESLSNEETKTRFLYDLEKNLTKNQMSFIRELLLSNNKRYTIFGLRVIANLKADSELRKVEEMLLSSEKEIQFRSIVTLGYIGNSETNKIIIPFLESSEQHLRRVAIEAVGRIDGEEMLNIFKQTYSTEKDFGNRIAIIEATAKFNDRNKIRDALSYFLTLEKDPFVISIIEKF